MHKHKVTKSGLRKLLFFPKWLRRGLEYGHRIDYNGVGVLRGQREIPRKINRRNPPGPYARVVK